MAVTYDYSYNNIEVNNPYSEEDYGSITAATTQTDADFGDITEEAEFNFIEDNWYEISITESLNPFGSIGTLASPIQESASYSFVPSPAVTTISGSSVNRIVHAWTGTGTLFEIGNGLERTLRPYVSSGTLRVDPNTTATHNVTFNDVEDTAIVNILGISETRTFQVYGKDYITTGGITISGELVYPDVDYTPSPDGSGFTTLSGESYVIRSRKLDASGSLFAIGTKFESKTYVYDEEDVVDASEDYGFVSGSVEDYNDYGQVTTPAEGQIIDYGAITAPAPTGGQIRPFGSIYLSGNGDTFPVAFYEYVGLGTLPSLYNSDTVHPNVDYTPSPDGSGLVSISGSAIEKDVDSYVGAGTLFVLSGSSESLTANPPENTVLYSFSSGYSDLRATYDEVGIGTLTLSANVQESESESYSGSGLLTISGSALESDVDDYVTFETDISISGFIEERSSVSEVGSGTYSINANLVERISYDYVGVGTLVVDENVDSRNYQNVYPGNGNLPDNAGIGTIRLLDAAITKAFIPVKGSGITTVSGTALESFGYTNYEGSGIVYIPGDAITSTNKLFVYDGSGTLVKSTQTQPILEKKTFSYFGSGTYVASGSAPILNQPKYYGSGSLFLISGATESLTSQTPEDTVLYNIVGSALERTVSQTPEDTSLYEVSGTITEKVIFDYQGDVPTLTLSGNSTSELVKSYRGNGLFRFVNYNCDNDYDTCDSDYIFSDYVDTAKVSFVANPPENTQLFEVQGSGFTSVSTLQVYSGFASVGISGNVSNIHSVKDYVGFGTVYTSRFATDEKQIYAYLGIGTISTLSGVSESAIFEYPTGTVLFEIQGTSTTKVHNVYTYSGSGSIDSVGTIQEEKISYNVLGSTATLSLSGELVHPDIKFFPSYPGTGLFIVSSESDNSFTVTNISTGNLFTLSGGFESFSKSTYIGLGTIFTQSVSGVSINNPYQIPRTYICII